MHRHSYFIYIISSTTGTLYIGVTNDLARRISEHKQGLVEGFAKKYGCTKLIYYEDYSDIKQAIAREKYLKGKTRKFKENIIKKINPHWHDLSDEWV